MEIQKVKIIKLVIDSDIEQVDLIGSCVNKLSRIFKDDDNQAYDIELACVEAINNCIEHAYNNLSGNTVQLNFMIYSDRFEIQIIDNGLPADNLKLDSELEFDTNDIDNLPEGGMGLFLIKQIMDKVSYTIETDRNIFSMTKYFN